MDTSSIIRNNASNTNLLDKRSTVSQKTVESQGEKFGEVWEKIQAQYGGKAERPKEIKKTLGKDDFLKLMITQMKNQDPTKPFNAEQMAGQMAQYASVEQLQNINQSIGKLQTSNQPMERLAMTNLIGKVVTVDRERFPHTEGQSDSLQYSLPRDATSVKITVVTEQGETLWEKDLGSQKAGENSATWDGLKSNTLPAKAGHYAFKIIATDDKGMALQTNPRTQGRVIGVSFEGAEPVFLVGDPSRPDKITIKNIVKIDTDGGSNQQIPGATSFAGAQAAQQSAGPQISIASPLYNPLQGQAPSSAQAGEGQSAAAAAASNPSFFTFKKGEGSQSLDPDAARQLAAFQARQAANRQAPIAADDGERGFPNGLSSGSSQTQPTANDSGSLQGPGSSMAPLGSMKGGDGG